MRLLAAFERWLGVEAARGAIASATHALLVGILNEQQVLVSDHAARRILERDVCQPWKVEKVIRKAWNSKEVSRKLRRLSMREPHRKFRLFNGCIYVFAKNGNVITLVTVMRPGVR